MNNYVLSETADADIEGIARYSIKQWGLVRAERYMMQIILGNKHVAEGEVK
jgi:plasmid stabilization system protein ParE